jgi:anaerobic ribonucleoside-triphosphate reductase activating protein
VVWFQGCSLGCAGCFNPATHPDAGGEEVAVAAVVDDILRAGDSIEGLTISGGEPLQQPEALLELVSEVRRRSKLSILVFSGYSRAEIEAMPSGRRLLGSIDVLIDGRYLAAQRLGRELRGSANQTVHLLTGRYAATDIERTPEAEIKIRADGSVVVTGVNPPRVRRPG